MKLIRHTVSGPTSSMSLVCRAQSEIGQNLRAVFQSPGDDRRKVAFACAASELENFIRILGNGRCGEEAVINLFRNRGYIKGTTIEPGHLEIRYGILPSSSRGGTKGLVTGHYSIKPVKN